MIDNTEIPQHSEHQPRAMLNAASSKNRIFAKKHVMALAAVMLFQLCVLGGELLAAVYPHWTGQPIRVQVQPVDPRDLFRGNYARLQYSFNVIDETLWHGGDTPKKGQRVYVTLVQNEAGSWDAAAISDEPPEDGMFLRGRFKYVWSAPRDRVEGPDGKATWVKSDTPDRYRIEYGVEAWFAPKEKAQALELALRDEAWATLYVADNGKAALFAVETSPKDVE
ncbi:MAG: GDYXXLXY domain-containing protein [Alcanivoracaceae bacterium]|nr:GDYXXLXY domain-containing protein [Alcanivoracaceae bacterium]